MNIYTLKVGLTGPHAPDGDAVWRLIEVKGNQTLHSLHRAIFRAFDRWEEHLYSFFMSEHRRNPSQEYTSPIDIEEAAVGGVMPGNAAATRLSALGLTPSTKFYYLFDFGDSWEHIVEVISVQDKEPGGRYPAVVERHGESPLQYRYEDDEEGDL